MLGLRRRLVVLALAATGLGALGGAAQALDGDGGSASVSATITSGAVGARSVLSASPVVMTSALNGVTMSSPFVVVVDEAVRSGTNPWSVTAVLSGPLTSGASSIAATNLSVSGRSVAQVGGGGASTAPAGSQDLSLARTLLSNAGQDPSVVYTGTYTATSTLTLGIPNGTTVGTYGSTITVTLIQ